MWQDAFKYMWLAGLAVKKHVTRCIWQNTCGLLALLARYMWQDTSDKKQDWQDTCDKKQDTSDKKQDRDLQLMWCWVVVCVVGLWWWCVVSGGCVWRWCGVYARGLWDGSGWVEEGVGCVWCGCGWVVQEHKKNRHRHTKDKSRCSFFFCTMCLIRLLGIFAYSVMSVWRSHHLHIRLRISVYTPGPPCPCQLNVAFACPSYLRFAIIFTKEMDCWFRKWKKNSRKSHANEPTVMRWSGYRCPSYLNVESACLSSVFAIWIYSRRNNQMAWETRMQESPCGWLAPTITH